MLFAVIMRFDSLREIEAAMTAGGRKLAHFSDVIAKGINRHPKNGNKNGCIKAASVIHANENVPCNVRFSSAVTKRSCSLRHITVTMR